MPTVVASERIRRANRRLLHHLGFGAVPLDLPDGPVTASEGRSPSAVVERALALHVVLAVTRGFEPAQAGAALSGMDVVGALTPVEVEYLDDAADGIRLADAARATEVEALAALLWSMGLLDDLPADEPARHAADVLGRPGDPLPEAVVSAALRPVDELAAALDLYAGMVWALAADPDLAVGQAPGPYDPYVARERYRALAWVFGASW